MNLHRVRELLMDLLGVWVVNEGFIALSQIKIEGLNHPAPIIETASLIVDRVIIRVC